MAKIIRREWTQTQADKLCNTRQGLVVLPALTQELRATQ